jgi:hypothetical protein
VSRRIVCIANPVSESSRSAMPSPPSEGTICWASTTPLFLNGLPLLTAELNNPLNGQDVKDAIPQYHRTCDPREPLFVLGRCVAH